MIPLHLSGAVIAGIFVLLAVVSVAITWVFCVIADEWREADWFGDDRDK
jgi:hypothetical protein